MELFVQGCAVVNQNLILNGDNGFEEIFGLQIVELHALCSSDADFDMARAAVECIQRTKEPQKLLLQCRSPLTSELIDCTVGGWYIDGSVHLSFLVGVASADFTDPTSAVAAHSNDFVDRGQLQPADDPGRADLLQAVRSTDDAEISSVWSSEIDSGRLKVKEELGRGRRSIVHRAYYSGTDCDVAVKFIEGLATVHDLEIIRRGIEAAMQLNHPHLIAYYGGVTEASAENGLVVNHGAAILTEFCRGGCVASRIHDLRSHGPRSTSSRFTLAVGLKVCQQAASALDYLHGHGVEHGNIKPTNCMLLTPALNPPHMVLTDFGSCVGNDERTSKADAGYRAPEVRRDAHGARADIFAYGYLMYTATALCFPQEAADPAAGSSFQIEVQDWSDIEHMPDLATLIMDCCCVQVELRPPARDVVARLGDVLDQESAGSTI
jgi:hypothetical protein